jgi:hypothetical protein
MANYSYSFMAVGQARFSELLKAFRTAQGGFQVALGAAIYQAVAHNNPNWLSDLFADLWLSTKVGDKWNMSKTGKLIHAYMTAEQDVGGLGLKGVFRFDRKEKRVSLDKGRFLTLDEIDHDILWATLEETRYDEWNKPKEPKQYKPIGAVERITKKFTTATEKGETLDVDLVDLDKAIAELRMAVAKYNASR